MKIDNKGETVLKNNHFKKKLYSYVLLGSLVYASTLNADEIPLDLSVIELQLDESSTPSTDEQTQEEASKTLSDDELKEKFHPILYEIIDKRNDYLLKQDLEQLKTLYDTSIKTGRYAYENESIKIKYLKNWAEKQDVHFKSIESFIHMRKVRDRENGKYGMTCNVATLFTYAYNDTPDTENKFVLGTSHYIHLQQQEDETFVIVKEWYTDPFADSLDLKNINSEEMKTSIGKHQYPNYTPDERTQKAIDYAHQYCGVSFDDHPDSFKYNPKYINCNPRGGDCANFASQIMHEGGGFKKNSTWNYDGDGTKAWLNAQAFKNYIVNSGRGSYIAKGNYKKIYQSAYQMRPGDFVAYEKKGRITHVSTVTGLDSKGYPLVTCHNTDRLLVPYDLGWSNEHIIFHLIDVHY